ncbi:Ulp1-like peptidase [Cucumis melo var. makuwa]|uniref:Ulp1-like peptidase n=1 Tax=Cucumis melo var. makuwa TaxID=1194695 RepID=A0A5A7TVU5_CUCMM|nr:Ulp1-like peptidase [Cucumis melo var. makuwa]TYK02617.1 Ulp1-like peptidase [Cucumis melo var. makuwa]
MLHIKQLCKYTYRVVDSAFIVTDNKKVEWTDTTAHLELWTESDLEYYFNTALGDFQDKEGWGDVNYMIGCINIREHRLTIATDMKKCKIYVFDSMPKYVEKKLVDEALEMHAQCIPSLAIAIGMNLS